ncbi:putative acetyltransferase [Gemmata sp. SH-PL17]|nr:putative acetyltransferase [Gemmata sp. SH-PL17]
MTKNFVIRPATTADVSALVALMTDFYAESGFVLPPVAAARTFTTLLGTPEFGAVWVAEVSGRLIGHVVLTLAFSMEYGGPRGFIDDLFVCPAARRQGAGTALLAVARAEAIARGVRALCVETGGADHPARPLYARAGYTESGRTFLTQVLAAPVHAT